MKTIGLLGGTMWPSTISYYTKLNQLVAQKLGGYHSAKILLKSIDYNDIMVNYGKDDSKVAQILKSEIQKLSALKPDCIIICCNSLHKFYDMVSAELQLSVPVFHAVDLVANYAAQEGYKKVLLLATKFTMEDGFFAHKLEAQGIKVTIPSPAERDHMARIHQELEKNIVLDASRNYFRDLIASHRNLDAVVLGCTEYPMVVDKSNSVLPIIDPVNLQVGSSVAFALGEGEGLIPSPKPQP